MASLPLLRTVISKGLRPRIALRTTSLGARNFSRSLAPSGPSQRQSTSPLGPIGVEAALTHLDHPNVKQTPTIYKEFDLSDRVAVVSGGNRGLGLEMALALCELGAVVYCLDLPENPGKEWEASKRYVENFNHHSARLEYVKIDVTNQAGVWDTVRGIGDKEGRMDVCVAAAGILRGADCLEYQGEEFQKARSLHNTVHAS